MKGLYQVTRVSCLPSLLSTSECDIHVQNSSGTIAERQQDKGWDRELDKG